MHSFNNSRLQTRKFCMVLSINFYTCLPDSLFYKLKRQEKEQQFFFRFFFFFCRFFEPGQGTIKIAGRDIRDVDMDNLRKSIAIVPQDSVLFHNTIRLVVVVQIMPTTTYVRSREELSVYETFLSFVLSDTMWPTAISAPPKTR